MENLHKKLILIIEDEESMNQALSDMFVNSGYAVDRAKTGGEGLALALKDHPDLIILDILMPGMDGMTTINQLRQDEWGKSVPVIFLTNVDPESNQMLKSIMESKPAYFLIKSNVSLDNVVEKATELLTPKNPA